MNLLGKIFEGSKRLKTIMKLREFAEFKRAERPKKEKSTKTPYEWGSIGLSTVSAEIKKDHGVILSRQERKQWSREKGKPFAKYYNN